jgi:hypothetical protein
MAKQNWRRRLALLWTPVLLSSGLPVRADEAPPIGRINEYIRITGDLRGRYEAVDFFKPAPDPAAGVVDNNNDYGLGAVRARIGVAVTTPHADGFVQGQYTGLYGLPDNAFAGIPVGPLGLGGAYFRDSGAVNPGEVFLKQGYLNLKFAALGLPGGSLKAGRFEILDGLEYRTGDAKFDLIKTTRVSQRLVGPFDFTHITRSFDGFSAVYDRPAFNLTLDAAHPTQGGFNIHAQNEISKVDLFYGALTSKRGALLPGTEGRLFYLYYGDDRNVPPVDNRPLPSRPALSRSGLKIHTVGSHLLTVQPLGAGSVDAVLWGAYQFGDWGNLNQNAYALDAEAGYQWTGVSLKPWLRAGYSISSGDSDAGDRSHGTFFQAIPTVRLYAKFPFFNQMNLQDAFAQFNVSPTQATRVGVDFHHLSLTQSSDLFYGGSGATSRTGTFGYFGRASGGGNHVGELVDISFTHNLTSHFSWSFYYAHAFGGEVTRNVYRLKNDADYGFLEFNLSL